MEDNPKQNIEIKENSESEKNELKKYLNRPEKKRRKYSLKWPLVVLVITLILSLMFSLASEFLLTDTGLLISIILLVFFLVLAMISDMIGVASTSADIEPFNAMCSKKIKGAKETLKLIQNAEKVSSVFCDIVGDICGILSGAIGATLVIQIIGTYATSTKEAIVASIISATIASLTVFLKSVGKIIAINNSNKIMFTIGKIISFFKFKK